MATFVNGLHVACNDRDRPGSLALLYDTHHVSTVYWISYFKKQTFPNRSVAHRMLSSPNSVRMMYWGQPHEVRLGRIWLCHLKAVSAEYEKQKFGTTGIMPRRSNFLKRKTLANAFRYTILPFRTSKFAVFRPLPCWILLKWMNI